MLLHLRHRPERDIYKILSALSSVILYTYTTQQKSARRRFGESGTGIKSGVQHPLVWEWLGGFDPVRRPGEPRCMS